MNTTLVKTDTVKLSYYIDRPSYEEFKNKG